MPASKKPKTLIVQGREETTRKLKRFLGSKRFALHVAENQQHAAELLRSTDFDVALLDLPPRARACKTACRKINKVSPDLPIIVIAGTKAAARSMASGCNVCEMYLSWDLIDGEYLRSLALRTAEKTRQDRSLKEARDFTDAVLDTVGSLIMISDAKGRIVHVNRTFEEALGYSDADLVGEYCWSLMAEKNDIRNEKKLFRNIKADNFPFSGTIKFRAKGGAIKTTKWNCKTLTNDDGTVRNVVSSGVDITAEAEMDSITTQIEAEARKAQERLADAIESINEAFVLHDADDKLVLWNSRFEEFYANHKDILKPGITFEEMFRTIVRRQERPEAEGNKEEFIQKRLRDRKKFKGPIERHLADGRWMLLSDRRTKHGEIVGIRTDITELKKREEALRESEELFSKAFHASPVLVALVEPKEGRYLDVNDTWLKTMGFKRREVIGRTSKELGIWANMQERKRLLDSLRNKTASRNIEVRRKTKKGVIKSFLLAAERFEYRGQQTLLVVSQDISELNKAKEDAQAAELRLVDALESINEGFVLHDADDRMVLCNSTYKEFYGLAGLPIEPGTSFEEIIDMIWSQGMHMDLEGGKKEFLEKRLKERQELQGPIERKLANGRWLLLNDRRTKRGEIVGVRTDITALKEREEALRESEELFSTAFHASPAQYGIVDIKTNRFVDVNETWLRTLGFKRKEVIGRTPLQLGIWLDRKERARFVKTLKETGSVRNFEGRFRRKGGEILDFLMAGEIIELGGRSHMLVISLDITERKRAEEALRHAHDGLEIRVQERTRELREEIEHHRQTEKELLHAREQAETASLAKSRFLSNMSHELRTPLNAILGFSGTIKEKIFGPIDNLRYEEYISNIIESGHHLLELIDDILDLSKIEADALELFDEKMDVSPPIESSIRFVRPRAEQKRLRIIEKIDSRLPKIVADERRFKQILINLLSNAVKFTPRGGAITVSARVDKSGSMHIKIADTGIGMKKTDIPTAFAEFGQVESAVARRTKGTGLGLPLTKGLVEMHEGTLGITSREGKGTSVTIRLPAHRVLT